jgi:phosphohistidine phosphatase
MKKTLLLVRHAKTEKDHESGMDSERKLTARGKEDARKMAIYLRNEAVPIDTFISSPAARARKTCKIFTEVYGTSPEKIIFKETLYLPDPVNFIQAISKIDDSADHIAIFSHNPGITEFAGSLCNDVSIDHMPPGSVFAVEADIKNWKDFESAKKRFLFFRQPLLL